MALPNTLLLTYQIEFETTDITIDSLCQKYGITTKDLKGYTKWEKRTEEEEDTHETEVITTPALTTTAVIATTPNSAVLKEDTIAPAKSKMLEDIEEFKTLAVAHAIKFMKDDAEFAEVKEFKDMVAVIDSIEKSYKDIKETPPINILIQNLQQKFKDTPDDC